MAALAHLDAGPGGEPTDDMGEDYGRLDPTCNDLAVVVDGVGGRWSVGGGRGVGVGVGGEGVGGVENVCLYLLVLCDGACDSACRCCTCRLYLSKALTTLRY